MRHYKLILSAILFIVIGVISLHAQEGIPSASGDASGDGGTISYSIGQLVCNTYNGTNGTVSQGLQQPFEISVVTGIDELSCITLECNLYPNPVTDFLTLKIENLSYSTFHFQLIDFNGKLLENRKFESNETIIAVNNLIPAIYFLKIFKNNEEVKTFKIIKN
jgi:hypothetical protein